jgi:hypothetical protein
MDTRVKKCDGFYRFLAVFFHIFQLRNQYKFFLISLKRSKIDFRVSESEILRNLKSFLKLKKHDNIEN